MPGIKITESDMGLNELLSSLKAFNDDKSALYIGVQFPDRKYADGVTVGYVGLLHEFGKGRVPPARWIRGTFERKKAGYMKIIEEELGRALDSKRRVSAKSIFMQLGPIIGRDMKDAIREAPLIDTGLLLRSVGWRVAKQSGAE